MSFVSVFFFLFDPAVSDGFDNFHPPSTPVSGHPSTSSSSYGLHSHASSQHQQHHHHHQQQQQQPALYSHGTLHGRAGIPQPLHLHPMTHTHAHLPSPLTLTPTASSGSSLPNSPVHAQYTPATPGPSSGLTALLAAGSGGNSNSVPTSVIQAPLTASPTSSSGSPSGGEDNYFSELALYNLGGYSANSGLASPQRRKKMRKSRSPGPEGCGGSGKRKNREGTSLLHSRRQLVNLNAFFLCFSFRPQPDRPLTCGSSCSSCCRTRIAARVTSNGPTERKASSNWSTRKPFLDYGACTRTSPT